MATALSGIVIDIVAPGVKLYGSKPGFALSMDSTSVPNLWDIL